jgi:hypothetical protein
MSHKWTVLSKRGGKEERSEKRERTRLVRRAERPNPS